MKRSSLVLSVIGASVLGCLAFSSTASAVVPGDWGPDPCVIVYDYCLIVEGHSSAYCLIQEQECKQSGFAPLQNRLHAKNNLPPDVSDTARG